MKIYLDDNLSSLPANIAQAIDMLKDYRGKDPYFDKEEVDYVIRQFESIKYEFYKPH